MNKYTKLIVLTLIGSCAGFAYYYFVGCDSNCTIQSSWINSTLYGATLGLILGFPSKVKNSKQIDK